MNERIRSIAIQCHHRYSEHQIDLEKFAEMIVQECASLVVDDYVILDHFGIRQQIMSAEFDSIVHINLGDTRQYFRCRNKLTNKEKNISIYEWDTVKDSYDILDQSQFIKATTFAEGK